jgi:hypothetical protein
MANLLTRIQHNKSEKKTNIIKGTKYNGFSSSKEEEFTYI